MVQLEMPFRVKGRVRDVDMCFSAPIKQLLGVA